MAQSADNYLTQPADPPGPPSGPLLLRVGALLFLRGPEAAHRLPRPDPQGGDGRLSPRWGSPLRDPALGEGLHRLPERAGARAAPADRSKPRAPGARLHRRQQGGARRAHPPDHQDRPGQRLRLHLRRLRLHGRGRRVRRRHREGRPQVHRPLLSDPDRRRQEGRGQAHRALGERRVTPGINNVTARTLVKKHPTREQLLALVTSDGLAVRRSGARRHRALPRGAGRPYPLRLLRARGSTSSPSRSSAPRCRRR